MKTKKEVKKCLKEYKKAIKKSKDLFQIIKYIIIKTVLKWVLADEKESLFCNEEEKEK